MKKLAAMFILAGSSQVAFAGFTTGNQLNEWSDASSRVGTMASFGNDSAYGNQYFGYIKAVVDTYEPILCLPYEMTLGQAEGVVRQYLKSHPERWNESASLLVVSALKTAFPCSKK